MGGIILDRVDGDAIGDRSTDIERALDHDRLDRVIAGIFDGRGFDAGFGADHGTGKATNDGADGTAGEKAKRGAARGTTGCADGGARFGVDDTGVLGKCRDAQAKRNQGHRGQKGLLHFCHSFRAAA
ncbi:hypothetical protein D3C87_1768450 [compost metagenome]